MNTKISKHLDYVLTQIRGRDDDGCEICLEIPAFFIKPRSENYGAFGLSVYRSQFESSLKFIRVVHPRQIEKKHIRLHYEERTEQFDLTAENFEEQIINFLYS